MNHIDNILAAYECDMPGNNCEFCQYGYGYLDDTGDYSFWWCDEEKILNDAVELLKVIYGKI